MSYYLFIHYNIRLWITYCLSIVALTLFMLLGASGDLQAAPKQVGAFGVKSNADKVVKKYQAQGKHAFIKVKTVRGKKIYAVVVDDAVVAKEPVAKKPKPKSPEPIADKKFIPPSIATPPVATTPAIEQSTTSPAAEAKPDAQPKLFEIPAKSGNKALVIKGTVKLSFYKVVNKKKTFASLGTYAQNAPAKWLSGYKSRAWYRVELADGTLAYILQRDVLEIKTTKTVAIMPATPAKPVKQKRETYTQTQRSEHSKLGLGLHAEIVNLSVGPLLSYMPREKIALQAHYGMGYFTTYGVRALLYTEPYRYGRIYYGAGYKHSAIDETLYGVNITPSADGFSGYLGVSKDFSKRFNFYLEVSGTSVKYDDVYVTSGGTTYKITVAHSPISGAMGLMYKF